jgi:hypothetical protein
MNSDTPPPPAARAADEIDLRRLVHVLWQYRRSVILVAALGVVLGGTVSWLSTRYRTEGLFLTPKLDLPSYKPLEASFASRPTLEAFLRQSGQADSRAAELLRDMVEIPGALGRAVQPVFAFTDRDAKQFGVQVDEAGIVGLRLTLEEKGKFSDAPVRLLGEYMRDTRIKVELEDQLLEACRENGMRERELRNEQLQSDFGLRQQQDRAETLRAIASRTSSRDAGAGRQLVSLENGGERFLSPVTQLVAVEVAIAEIKLADERRARDLITAGLRREFYCRAAAELKRDALMGTKFLDALPGIQRAVFEGQDMARDIVEHTANTLSIQQATWKNHYVEKMRFVTAPEDAQTRVRRPGMGVGVLLGGVLGGLTGILLALLRAWWRVNRAVVVAED